MGEDVVQNEHGGVVITIAASVWMQPHSWHVRHSSADAEEGWRGGWKEGRRERQSVGSQ